MHTSKASVTQPNHEIEDYKDTKENIKLIPEIGDVADVKPYCKNETLHEIKVEEITIKDEYVVVLPGTAAKVTQDGKFDVAPNNTTELKFTIKQEHISLFSDSENAVEQDETNIPADDAAKLKVFKCDHCTYTGSKKQYLKNHMLRHTSDRPYKCKVCDYSTVRQHDLKMHVRRHTADRLYKCKECDYACRSNHQLAKHRQLHSGTLHTCKICSYSSCYRDNFKNHMKTHTGQDIKNFKCDVCSYIARRKSFLKTHIMEAHAARKRYRCDKCEFSDDNISLLIAHMKARHN